MNETNSIILFLIIKKFKYQRKIFINLNIILIFDAINLIVNLYEILYKNLIFILFKKTNY